MAKNLIFFFILLSFSGFAQRKTISGYIYEKGSRESLVGVNVYNPDSKQGSTSNIYGFYSLTLNATDTVVIRWSYVGYQTIEKKYC